MGEARGTMMAEMIRYRDRLEFRPLIRIRCLEWQGCIEDGCSIRTAVGSDRLGAVSPFQPVVVDADRLKLELHRRHDLPDVLDHRGGFLRDRRVHGLLRLSLSAQGGKAGSLRA